MLTAQEVNKGCGITVGSSKTGELDTCKYLMENTVYTNSSLLYGYGLESVHSLSTLSTWIVYGLNSHVNYNNAGGASSCGVRPAIVVLKSKINY